QGRGGGHAEWPFRTAAVSSPPIAPGSLTCERGLSTIWSAKLLSAMARRLSRPATAPDVTSRLREAITRGTLMPNERLIEADLAGQYRVNRAHIRTALAMLDQEGLVVREKNRGARVRAITDSEALEIADTRLAIEVMVARQAAARASAADRKTLRAIESDMRAAVANEDYSLFSQCNAALHREVLRMAGNA